MAEWQIESLADDHDRAAFACGNATLDVFLRTQAGQYSRKGVGRTFVAVRPPARVVIGFYTLAASSIEFQNFPKALSKRLPKHPVPMILLGRLAVDGTARGKGLGGDLLIDALSRSLRIADELGVFAVHVHAIDEAAAAFYARHGFQPLPDQPQHMLLPLETFRKALGGKKP
jgi:GNAT superfamily N-acetyltransferase